MIGHLYLIGCNFQKKCLTVDSIIIELSLFLPALSWPSCNFGNLFVWGKDVMHMRIMEEEMCRICD